MDDRGWDGVLFSSTAHLEKLLQDSLGVAQERSIVGAAEEIGQVDHYVAHRKPGDKLIQGGRGEGGEKENMTRWCTRRSWVGAT